jgi:hypothetical protein
MTGAHRTPPRFVPTLTTVVEVPEAKPDPREPPSVALAAESHETPRDGTREPAANAQMRAISEEDAFQFEDALVHRVMQRVDLSLEARLTDTVSAAVQQQLDSMLPRLREEIEAVLRSLVIEALAGELSETTGSATGLPPESFS